MMSEGLSQLITGVTRPVPLRFVESTPCALPPLALNGTETSKLVELETAVKSSCTSTVAEPPGGMLAMTGTGNRLGSRLVIAGAAPDPATCAKVNPSRRTSFASPAPVFVILSVTTLALDGPDSPVIAPASWAGAGAAVSSTSRIKVSYPIPLPAAEPAPRVSVIVLAPTTSSDAGKESVARRGYPLRSA